MRVLPKALVVLALSLPLAVGVAPASAQDRTTGHDLLLTAGTVVSSCPTNPSAGDTCDEFWFAAAVGTERRDGVAQQVNRVQVFDMKMAWTNDGWITTQQQQGEATGAAVVAANLKSATFEIKYLPMYVNDESGSTATGETVSASVRLRSAGSLDFLGYRESDRGTWPGPLTIGHYERWRPATATVTVNGAGLAANPEYTYIGSYLGQVNARGATANNGKVNGSYLKSNQPGATRAVYEQATAQGAFGSIEINAFDVVGHPELGWAGAFINGNWLDMTGNPDFKLAAASQLSGATATIPVTVDGVTTKWSLTWSQAGPLQAERAFNRYWSVSGGSRSSGQNRAFSEQRDQTVRVTISGTHYTSSGALVLSQTSSSTHTTSAY